VASRCEASEEDLAVLIDTSSAPSGARHALRVWSPRTRGEASAVTQIVALGQDHPPAPLTVVSFFYLSPELNIAVQHFHNAILNT